MRCQGRCWCSSARRSARPGRARRRGHVPYPRRVGRLEPLLLERERIEFIEAAYEVDGSGSESPSASRSAAASSTAKELNAKIRAFIDGWNDRAHPFVWTKTPEQVLAKAALQT